MESQGITHEWRGVAASTPPSSPGGIVNRPTYRGPRKVDETAMFESAPGEVARPWPGTTNGKPYNAPEQLISTRGFHVESALWRREWDLKRSNIVTVLNNSKARDKALPY